MSKTKSIQLQELEKPLEEYKYLVTITHPKNDTTFIYTTNIITENVGYYIEQFLTYSSQAQIVINLNPNYNA